MLLGFLGAQFSEQEREQELVFEQVSMAQETSLELSSRFEKALQDLGIDVHEVEFNDSGFKISYSTHLDVEEIERALASLLNDEQKEQPFSNLEISFAGDSGNAASGAVGVVHKEFYNDQFRNGQLKFFSLGEHFSSDLLDVTYERYQPSFYGLASSFSDLHSLIPESRAGPKSA